MNMINLINDEAEYCAPPFFCFVLLCLVLLCMLCRWLFYYYVPIKCPLLSYVNIRHKSVIKKKQKSICSEHSAKHGAMNIN